jgi:hypothetical protein
MNYMIVKIDESTVKSTTNCSKGMPCLDGVKKTLCEVDECVSDEVFFVKCLNNKLCSYRINFGYDLMCTCPIRKEIYKRYKY